jgi:hypothetical protein
MKVDWGHSEYFMSNFRTDLPTFPAPGGQYTVTVPQTLATVRVSAQIHTDQEDGTLYVQIDGSMRVPPTVITDPDYYFPNYWPYEYTGWPVLAILPGDIFNADVTDADPDYEGGGKYIESAMVAKNDPDGDWGADTLWNYNKFGGAPYQMTQWPLGNVGRGGGGFAGVESLDDIFRPPSDKILGGWTYRAISQQCWVLIVIDPSGHKYGYDVNPPSPDPWRGAGKPMVISASAGGDAFTFNMMWKLREGLGIPEGLFIPGGGASGQSPSTVDIQ